MTSNRRVGEWTKWSSKYQSSLLKGDLIEFNRGSYCHWGMYYVDGLVVHFNPADEGEKVNPLEGHKFIPGKVTRKQLKDVAGKGSIYFHFQENHYYVRRTFTD